MANLHGWETVERLGEGGQGEVFLARSPDRSEALRQARTRIPHSIRNLDSIGGNDPSNNTPQKLAEAVWECVRPDLQNEVGALKRFKMPSDNEAEEGQAVDRLKAEIHALGKIDHPAVLKLLDSSIDERFIVTEFHPEKTLDKNLHRYRGNALAALKAFRSLVDGVRAIHSQGAIHRDIKPENIFLTTSGNLVLGDFGIVFFQEGPRLTTTYEKVGTSFWMAPWAYQNVRLELAKIRPPLDLFPLGKVLWSMISGLNGFPYWRFSRDENNLANHFPRDPYMNLINERILSKCITEEEHDCVESAAALLKELDALIERFSRQVDRPNLDRSWPCRMCGRGVYIQATALNNTNSQLIVPANTQQSDFVNTREDLIAFVCSYCKHVELFRD